MAPNQDRSMLAVFGSLTAVAAFLLAAVGIIVVVNDDGSSNLSTASAPVTVTLTEFKITPGTINVPVGGSLDVVNGGTMVHNLAVTGGPTTPDLAAGKSATLDLSTLAAGTYEVTCTIAGHAAAGMKATLVVGGSGSERRSSGGTDMAMGAGTEPDYQAMDVAMEENTAAYLDAFTKYGTGVPTEGRGNQLLEPVADADGYKQINLTLSIIDWEVEPGKVVKAWAYNDMVPGPWIKVQPNDKLRVTLKNNTPDGPGHPLARHLDPVRPGRRRPHHPAHDRAGPDLHLRVQRPRRARDGHVPPAQRWFDLGGQRRLRPVPGGRAPAAGRPDRQRHQAARTRSRSPRKCPWCSTTPAPSACR